MGTLLPLAALERQRRLRRLQWQQWVVGVMLAWRMWVGLGG